MDTHPDVRKEASQKTYLYEIRPEIRGIIRQYAHTPSLNPDIVAVDDTDDDTRTAIEYIHEGSFDEDAGGPVGWLWVAAGSPYSDAAYAGHDTEGRDVVNTLVNEYDWTVTHTSDRGADWLD